MINSNLAIGLDLDGTLVIYSLEYHKKVQEKIAELASKIYGIYKSEVITSFKKEWPSKSASTILSKTLGIDKKEAKKMVEKAIKEIDPKDYIENKNDKPLQNLLEKLKNREVYLCLVTSSPKESAKRKLDVIGINLKLFDYTLFGVSKSNGEAYEKWINECGGGNYLYVGDSFSKDVLVPLKLDKIIPVLIDFSSKGIEERTYEGKRYYSIENIYLLEDLLFRICRK